MRTVLEHIGNCKTEALGGHKISCTACQSEIYSWNSCGDSHCPQCQNIKKELWVDKMANHLLPIKHFHVIFTLPHELNDFIFHNQTACYSLLFSVSWAAICEIVGLENRTGMVATLHTWGSNLAFHPHLHCIIPSGSYHGQNWQLSQYNNGQFYCKASDLRETFKRFFLVKLQELIETEDLFFDGQAMSENAESWVEINRMVRKIKKKKWSVRIENPVLGTEQIIEYLGRYVRRVAITNSRIEGVDHAKVTINYKKYAQQEKGKPAPIGKKIMEGEVFLQQFCQHILPFKFHRVRYYGIYGFAAKKIKEEIYTQLTNQPIPIYQPPSSRQIIKKMLGHDPDICSACGVMNQMESIPLVVNHSQLFVLTRRNNSVQIRAGPPQQSSQVHPNVGC